MMKRIYKWKPIRLLTIYGNEYVDDELPGIVANYYKGELVDKILTMDRKKPISLHQALNMASDAHIKAVHENRFGHKKGQSGWHFSHLIDFISEQGFHIELSGDEFDSPASNSN